MSNPTTGASPQPDATNPSGGKAEGGNNPVGGATGDPTQSQPADPVALQQQIDVLTKNYADSSRQAQQHRYMLEDEARKRKEAENRLAAATAPAQPVGTTAGALLKKAMYAEDEAGIDAALAQVGAEAEVKAQAAAGKMIQDKDQKTQRLQQLNGYFSPYSAQFGDVSDPTIQRTMQIYGEYESARNSGNFMNWVPNDTANIQVAPGINKEINLHLLKEAHQQALMQGTTTTTNQNPNTIIHTEASGTGGLGGRPGAKTANVKDMLTDGDISMALNETYGWKTDSNTEDEALSAYFEDFSEDMKAARKRTGRSVAGAEMGLT